MLSHGESRQGAATEWQKQSGGLFSASLRAAALRRREPPAFFFLDDFRPLAGADFFCPGASGAALGWTLVHARDRSGAQAFPARGGEWSGSGTAHSPLQLESRIIFMLINR